MTALSSVVFPSAAGGSLLRDAEGHPRGSALIGQNFDRPGEFWGRLSQTAERPYNAMAAAGGNLGTSNPALTGPAEERLKALSASGKVPLDLVTSSGSGLDPHISPEAALLQVERVSRATGQSPRTLESLLARNTEPRTFGVLGQPRVNVLRLNLDLQKLLKENR